MTRIRPIEDVDIAPVVALWEACGLTRPWNPPEADIARARGRGHGRALVKAAEAWLAARGIRKLELMVRTTNAAVKGFYERLGYREEPVAVLARWLDGTVPGG